VGVLIAMVCGSWPFLLAQDQPAGDTPRKAETLPLQPERSIEFTTREGTWLSLDVSPDGRTIVFELVGDLYTLPVEGGAARPIASGMPFDSQPRFSPDGKRLVFLSDRDGSENVWIASADGSDPKKLSKDEASSFASPAWSADGTYVIASRQATGANTYELWMYHVMGGAGVQITKASPKPETPRNQRINAMGAVASPDGRYLYYARRVGGFQYNATFPLWQIARRDTVTGDEDVLTQSPGSAVRPALSPDGSLLAYVTRHETESELRVRDLRTGEDRRVRYPVQRDDQESGFSRDLYPGYAFLPGGEEIVTTWEGRIQRVNIASGASREVPFSAEVTQQIGPGLGVPYRVDEGPVRARVIHDATQSPDGTRLAFSSLTHLYVMDLPGGAPRRLTTAETGEFQPAWSADGQWIAYVSWSAAGGHLWKVRADGSTPPQQLTRVAAFYSDPAWSPDGSRIVALRGSQYMRDQAPEEFGGPDVPRDLVWLPAQGGDATLIAPSRGLGKPHFTQETDRIYVYGVGFLPADGGQGLVSLRFDGTDRREHVKIVGKGIYANEEPVGADDARISPDGTWALALVQNQLHLVAVPQVGGSAPKVNVSSPSVAVRRLTEVGADYFAWADGGRTITWAVGATFFRVPLDRVDFETPPAAEKPAEGTETTPAARKPLPAESFTAVVELPRSTPRGSVVLRGARLVTMNGDEVIDSGDLVVTDNRIAAIGRRGRVAVPAGAQIIDVRGMTIVPGFVDTHAHWFELRKGVLDVQNPSFLANLAYGVTAGLDVQTLTNDTFAYQDLVDAGLLPGPRAYSTGPGVFSNNDFKTLEEARGVLAKYKEHYRTHNLKSYIVGNRKQRQFVVQAAKELGLMPTTEGGLDLKLDLTHAIDGFWGNEHSLPIVPLFKDVVEMYGKSGIGYTPTLLVNYGGPFGENHFYTTTEVHDDPKLSRFLPHVLVDQKTRRRQWFRKDEYAYPRTAASAAAILRAGGRIGVGSHGQLQGLGYHWEMWALASGGLTPMEVLRAATLHGAALIGIAQDIGSLEAGKLADLIVLSKNPLVDITNTNTVRYVMKNGELFDGETLDEIWPEKKPLGPTWWTRK
jgi:Tol biopolymer transport system component/imidazolonepropionase-like amidohydrolase